ncbi:MAG: NAD(P)-dependent alcohol dehydrogenase [Clostridia bacterium]|nr:NAD(P)-dependent alcohol dehydrogenase [Clostridia bacterium]
MKMMKVAVLRKAGQIEYETRPIPEIREDQVLVRMSHCGICGSDVHYYQHGRIGHFIVDQPLVLGHESAGEVTAVGSAVKHLAVGDKVTLEPGVPCGLCDHCRTGRYNLCPDVVFMATPPHDGAFAEYVAWPARWAYRLPGGMSTVSGALIEPLAVGFHAAARGQASVGQSALILGAGCIGLMTLLALKARGVHQVYVTDLVDIRLEKAKELGAAEVIHAGRESVIEKVMELTDGQGTDLVFETAGTEVTTRQTAQAVRRGGRVVLVGLTPDPEITYDFASLMDKEVDLTTVFRYHNLYPTCLDAAARIPLDLERIVTRTFSFDQIPEAFAWTVANRQNSVKVVISWQPSSDSTGSA